jgi:hypothetical protein
MMNYDQLLQEMTRLLYQQEPSSSPQQQQGTSTRLRMLNLILPAEYLEGQTIAAASQRLDVPLRTPGEQQPGTEENGDLWTYEDDELPPIASVPDDEEQATPPQQHDEGASMWHDDEEEEHIQAHFTASEQERAQQTGEEETPRTCWQLEPPSRRVLVLALICLVVLLSVMTAYACSIWLPPATVTIIPTSETFIVTRTLAITTTMTTSGAPGTSTTTTIPGRLLPTFAASQQKTVQTTGAGHSDAQAARGVITFYNSALYAQTIPAGTLLTGADSIQVVTDTDAVIPAGSLSVNGQATVSAHAVEVGPQGNINAGDIYGPCCRQNVMAANSAFSGGALARDYRVVSQQDLQGSTQSLTSALSKSMQAAEENQVNARETLITPPLCTSTTTSDHQAGDEAQQVSVTVQERCTGVVYSTAAMQQVMMQASASEASKTLGSDYRMLSTPQLTVTLPAQQQQQQDKITVQVKSASTWAYHFSDSQLTSMRASIAGMSTQTASKWLLRVPGVQQATFNSTNGSDVLPQDVSRIHMDVLYTSW